MATLKPIHLITIALMACHTSAKAEIYKCVDENGKVSYSDIGCTTAKRSKVKISDNTANSAQYRKSIIRQERQAIVQAYQAEIPKRPTSQDTYQQDAKERSLDMDFRSGKYTSTQMQAMKEAIKMSNSRNMIIDIKRGRYSSAELRSMFKLQDSVLAPTKPSSILAPTASPLPSIITNCDNAGCWDNNGLRYSKGAGSTYFPTTGGSCQLIGGQMHCS